MENCSLIKPILLFISFCLLFESCSIYKKTPITIEEASTGDKSVLIIINDGTKLSLSKIEKIDGKYYGTKQINDQTITLPLNEEEILKIRQKDKRASRFVTIASIVTGVALITTIILVIDLANDLNDDWNWGDDSSSN